MRDRCLVFTFRGYCWKDVVRDGRCLFHLGGKGEDEADRFERESPGELERMKENSSPYIDLSRSVLPGRSGS